MYGYCMQFGLEFHKILFTSADNEEGLEDGIEHIEYNKGWHNSLL